MNNRWKMFIVFLAFCLISASFTFAPAEPTVTADQVQALMAQGRYEEARALLARGVVQERGKYRWHEEWRVIYTFNDSNRIKKLNHRGPAKLRGQRCSVSAQHSPSPNRFIRSIICPSKEVAVDCAGKGKITRCEKTLGGVTLIAKIKRHLTSKAWREQEVEFERDNTEPY